MPKENNKLIIRLNLCQSEQAFRDIVATFPQWAGLFEANERYAKGVKERLSFGYMVGASCLGMLSLEFPFPASAVIYWMGVRSDCHGMGIEKALLRQAELFCLEQGIYSLTVETFSANENNDERLNAFKFYIQEGFRPLFQLPAYNRDCLMVYLNKIISPKLFQWIDLTHDLSESVPTWDGNCGFQHTDIVKYEESTTGCKFLTQRIEMLAGIGTHIDAPAHCFPQGKTIEEIPLQTLISPCVVINVSKEAHAQFLIGIQTIKEFEKEHGNICKNAFVIFYTGWERFWDEPENYHNNHRFPSVSKLAADYLVSKDIAGIGIDTLSPDRPDSGFPVHQALLGADKYIVENIANASLMPATGGWSFVMPIRTVKGTEAPVRLLGMLSSRQTHS